MKVQDIKKDGSFYSAWKALHHSTAIAQIKRGELFAPRNIQVDLEAYCPHSCEFCTYRNVNWQGHGMDFVEPSKRVPEATGLPKDVALRLPREMDEAGISSIELTGGGEPMVYPYIREFLEELARYPHLQVAIVSNGAALNASLQGHLKNLKWIRFSVDAITPETHSKVHRVPKTVLNTVIKHVKEIVARQFVDCKVGISFVITKHNYHEIAQAASFFKAMGVDNVRYTFTYDPNGDGALTPEQTQLAELAMHEARKAQDDNFRVFGTMRRLEYYSQPNTDFHFCGYQLFTWAIGYEGLVYPCCIMKYHKESALGDLKKQSLKELVYSQARQHYIDGFDVRKCKPCWLRDKNQFIEYLVAENPKHVDFV
jgi:radical SAM protein with 4Fe4S-binding SPASM domain